MSFFAFIYCFHDNFLEFFPQKIPFFSHFAANRSQTTSLRLDPSDMINNLYSIIWIKFAKTS